MALHFNGPQGLYIQRSLHLSGRIHTSLLINLLKVQLIGGTQTLVVHCNRLKPCYSSPQLQADNIAAQRTTTCPDQRFLPTYSDVSGSYMSQVAGYTSSDVEQPYTRPPRTQRPPATYDDYLRH